MVPPVMNSTATPGFSRELLGRRLRDHSRQLPPQMLTVSLSCAAAGKACMNSTKKRCE